MKRIALAVILALVGWSAQAQVIPQDESTAWRAGLDVAFGQLKTEPALGPKIEDDTSGFAAHIQYQFNQWFGLEGGYYVSGDFKGDVTPGQSGGGVKISLNGFTGEAIGYFPLQRLNLDDEGHFHLYGKLGYFNFSTDLTQGSSPTQSNHQSGLTGGGGARLDIMKNVALRAEWNWYDAEFAKPGQFWSANIGFEYAFGRPEKVAAAPAVAAPTADK